MKRQTGNILPYVLVLLVFIGIGSCSDMMSCKSSWAKSGLKTSWGFFQGCIVEVEPGRWMPENRVREMEVKPPKK